VGIADARGRHDFTARAGFSPELLLGIEKRGRRFGLSPRRLQRCARIARTIADLAGSDEITDEHAAEALLYRPEAAS